MPKIKVLFEAGPMVHGQRTGVGYYINHLIASLGDTGGLRLRGFYFNFLRRNQENLPKFDNVTFQRIWLIPGKLLSICRRLGFQPFLDLLVRERADIVLFTNYISLPLFKKTKSALVVYDLSFLDHPEFTQERNLRYLKRFFPESVKRADLVITISEFARARLLHYFPDIEAPVVVTPIPPVDTAVPAIDMSRRLVGLGILKKKYILYLGTIEPRKNLQNLIHAYALLDGKLCSEYSLVLAGGKGWKDEEILTEAAAQKGNGLKVILTGYISDEEKQALYANAACFILPSHYEGFGMPILEAMQHDIPVVISDIPVFHEVAGSAALYFDKDRPNDITKKLTLVLSDEAIARRLVEEGRQQLRSFSWEDNAARVVEAFQKIIT